LVFLAWVKALHWDANVGLGASAGMMYSRNRLQASILHDLELYQSFLWANAKFQTLREVSSHAS